MRQVYPSYDAKARFSEIMRRVRAGECVLISYRGEAVAEIRPLPMKAETFPQRLSRLEREGVLVGGEGLAGDFEPIAMRKGALARFLEARE